MSASLTRNFFANARGLTIADGGGVTWGFNANTNTLTVTGLSGVGIAPGSISNADLANSSLTVTAGTGLSGGGAVSLGSSVTVSLSTPVAIANGGTGQITAPAAYNALSPMTTLGDIEYESGANTAARLAGNTAATKLFLTQTGTGSASAAPVWAALVASDIGALGANPTAKVGLAAVNGSASTFMRSDGAPPIDLTISPTWTGAHTFTPSGGGVAITINASVSNWGLTLVGSSTAGQSLGLLLKAGTNSTDDTLLVQNQAGTLQFLFIAGDGHGTLGPSATSGLSWASTGKVTFSSSIGIFATAPPAQPTGYGTPTGNARTSSFAAGSISLANLAAEVAQMVIDLKSYGIFGA